MKLCTMYPSNTQNFYPQSLVNFAKGDWIGKKVKWLEFIFPSFYQAKFLDFKK